MNYYLLWPLFVAGFAFAAAFAGSGDVLYGAFWGFVVGCPVLGITRLYALTDDEADGKGLDVVAGVIGVMAGGATLGIGIERNDVAIVLFVTPLAGVSAYGASYLLLAAIALVVGRRGAIVGGCVLAGVGVPLWWWFNF